MLKAYLEPEVDTSREPFSWAPPDVDGLRLLAAAKLGWGGTHTDSILQPMLKRRQQGQVGGGVPGLAERAHWVDPHRRRGTDWVVLLYRAVVMSKLIVVNKEMWHLHRI